MRSRTDLPDEPPRIIKPRIPGGTWRPVIAITRDEVYCEHTGELFPASDLPSVLRKQPSSILVCQGFGLHLQRLERVLGSHPLFNYRVTPRYRESRRSGNRMTDTVVNFVGFQGDKISKRGSHYHYPLDPIHFVRMGIDELIPDPALSRLTKLLQWGQEVRDWCHEQQLQVKSSSGGLVAQLLHDPRFYPKARRKVPQLINSIARFQLPGNYYLLLGERKRVYQAIYYDLTSAHHTMASKISFPDANTLHAFGRWSNEDKEKLYAQGNSSILCRPGVFKLRLTVRSPVLTTDFAPPWLQHGGTRDVWVFSNELELITGDHPPFDVHIDGIVCALVSRESETLGLSAYAKFALGEIHRSRQYKAWLKPTLHSTYGVLAARPSQFETGYYRAKAGVKREYPMGSVSVKALARISKNPVESRIANVIHRGMIEAEVRKEVLWFARFLTQADRRTVLAVYADSLFIRDNGEPPKVTPPWWRIEAYLSDLIFYDSTHFTSRELTRLPGFDRSRRDDRIVERLLERDAMLYSAHKPLSRGGMKHASS